MEIDIDECLKIMSGNKEEQLADYARRFPEDEFPGRFPVRNLKYNVTTRFSSLSPEAYKLMHTNIPWVSNGIDYDISASGIIPSPCCYFDKAKHCFTMRFSENFFAYIWCASYFYLLGAEHLSQVVNGCNDALFVITDRMLERGEYLMRWAINELPKKGSVWLADFPSPMPTAALKDNECPYSLLANNIAINAMVFILYHEFTHAYFQDCPGVDALEQERRADRLAVQLCLHPAVPGNIKDSGLLLSILIGFNSLFHISPIEIALKGDGIHPSLLERIDSVFEGFESDRHISIEALRNIKVAQCVIYMFLCRFLGIYYPHSRLDDMDENETIEEYKKILLEAYP